MKTKQFPLDSASCQHCYEPVLSTKRVHLTRKVKMRKKKEREKKLSEQKQIGWLLPLLPKAAITIKQTNKTKQTGKTIPPLHTAN